MTRDYRKGKGKKWKKEREQKPKNILGEQRTRYASGPSSAPVAPLILYYLTTKGFANAPLSDAVLTDDAPPPITVEELHQLTAKELYTSPFSQTTLDLATDAQKTAYLALAMRKVPVAAMARALSLPEYNGEDLRKTKRPPVCQALKRDTKKEEKTAGASPSLSDEQKAEQVLQGFKVDVGVLRRAIALLVRWSDVADTEKDAITCARLLIACGDHSALPRHLEKYEFLQKALPSFMLLDSAVAAVTLPPHAERAAVESVSNMLALIGRFHASSTYQKVAMEGLEYLALAGSHSKLFRFARNLKPWTWAMDSTRFQALANVMVEKGNYAAAGQLCKIVKKADVQAWYLSQMMRLRASPTITGHSDIDEELLNLLVLDEESEVAQQFQPPQHPFLAVGRYEEPGAEGMQLFRLGSVFASQYVDSGEAVVQKQTQRLLAPEFLPYFLPRTSLSVVDDEESLASAIAYFSSPPAWTNGCDCVGLDVEVEPNRTKGKRNPCALLQVATRDSSFVIDLLTLGEKAAPLIAVLFQSPHWLKVGLGFKGDLKMLRNSYLSWGCFNVINRLLDINELYRQLHPSQGAIGDASLDKLCVYTYGRHLNKSQQCSNWALRPLSDKQLEYAALDSLCLVGMFDVMRESLQNVSNGAVDVHHFVTNINTK